MQERLEDWDEKLIGIAEKKKRNGTAVCNRSLDLLIKLKNSCQPDELLREEIKQRNEKISDLSNKYNTECQIRSRTEEERKNLSEKLVQMHTLFSNFILSDQVIIIIFTFKL